MKKRDFKHCKLLVLEAAEFFCCPFRRVIYFCVCSKRVAAAYISWLCALSFCMTLYHLETDATIGFRIYFRVKRQKLPVITTFHNNIEIVQKRIREPK